MIVKETADFAAVIVHADEEKVAAKNILQNIVNNILPFLKKTSSYWKKMPWN